MRLIDADHLKNKLGVWWDKRDEVFAEMIDECPTKQEPSGDLISRQAVLNILEREGHKWGNDYRDWVDAVNEVETFMPVNPQEPKTGHWIKAKPYMIEYTSCKWECSECEKSERFKYSYCPNCGCRMVEPQESEG